MHYYTMLVVSILTKFGKIHCTKGIFGSISTTSTSNYSKSYAMASTTTERPKTLVDPKTKYPLKLMEKIEVSPDTRLFRFALPSKDHILGLPVGQHIFLYAKINDGTVIRPYTPVTSDDDLGHMDLVIKVYFKNVHPKFPEGGKMGQYLNDLPIGSSVDCRGPEGELLYEGKGKFFITPDDESEKPRTIQAKKVNMIAGGSGITPMLQLIRAIIKDKKDPTCISIIYANQTENDILLRSDLEKIRDANPNKFKLWYTLDRPPTGWKYDTGFITEEMFKKQFYPPGKDTLVLMCGPPPMISYACIPNLKKAGYDEKLQFSY